MARDHIVLGLSEALGKVDGIVRVVKESADSAAARETLTSPAFGFSSEQVGVCELCVSCIVTCFMICRRRRSLG